MQLVVKSRVDAEKNKQYKKRSTSFSGYRVRLFYIQKGTLFLMVPNMGIGKQGKENEGQQPNRPGSSSDLETQIAERGHCFAYNVDVVAVFPIAVLIFQSNGPRVSRRE